ncbi:MAG TPA: replicative DNA helicase [Steroidobacteraceae bacterium]|nr:replicative DNA helicase [Steroidobacteraceae bacterium]
MSTPIRSRRDDEPALDGLTPPHSVEAEQSVLGALLIDGNAWDQAADVVGAEDFYRPDHRVIFEAMAELVVAGRPADVVTVSEQLERRGQLESAGGLAYLGTLVRDTPTAANVRTYATIVRERALLRRLLSAGRQIASSVFGSEGLSARDLVEGAEKLVFDIAEQGSRGRDGAVRVTALLPPLLDKIDEWHREPHKLRGLATGFTDFDNKTGGLRPGDLVVVAGRPSMGKSTLAVNMAEYAACNPSIRAPVAIFTLEMPSEQVLTRMLSSIGHVPLNSIRSGNISDDDWVRLTAATSQLSEAKIFIDETPALTPTELRARARRLKREHGLGLVVVDYLQLMQVSGNTENRATEIGEISRGLKALAKELELPVIALSQLNRGVEQRTEKKPVMSDLRECVAGDTLVCLTDGRRVAIRALVDTTPEVWALDERRRVIAARADKVWCVGRRAVFSVKLASGRLIRGTSEHRLLSGAGWTTVGALQSGDRLALSRQLPEPRQPRRWAEHELILLGHLVGDGSYLRHQPLRYTTASEHNSAAVTAAAQALGAHVTRHAGRGRWHQLLIGGEGDRWHASGVEAWLERLGIFDQRAHEKHLPEEVFTLANDQIALLLRHLWATGGSVTLRSPGQRGAPRVYFASCSERLVRDVAALLLRLGIIGRVRATLPAHGQPVFRADVSGAAAQVRFARLVAGFGPHASAVTRLLEGLTAAERSTDVDTLPIEASGEVRALMGERGTGARSMAAAGGTVYGGASRCHFAPSREVIADARQLESPGFADEPADAIFWDRVLSVQADGEEEVFDLTVPGPANWLADGIVTHNSGAIEQDADMILLIYRDEVYDKNTTKKGIAEIDLAKHRNGEIGTFLLTFQGQYARFVNFAPDAYAEGVLR